MRVLAFCIPLILLISFGHTRGLEVSFLYTFLFIFFQNYLKRRKLNKVLGNRIWLIIYVLGIFAVSVNYWTYGYTFGPYRDDSMYYYNIQSLAKGNIPYKFPTLFEIVLAPVYLFLDKIFHSVNHASLLLINWLLGSLIVLESVELVKLMVGRHIKCSVFLYTALLLNSIFLDSILNLYRDGMLIFLMLLGFRYGYSKTDGRTIVTIILVFLLRPASAFIMLLGLYAFRIKEKSRTPLIINGLYTGAVVLFALLFLDQTLGLGGYMRSAADGVGNISIGQLYETRSSAILNSQGGSGSETIRNLGIIGQILSLIPTIFAPFKIHSYSSPLIVDIFGISNFQYTGVTTRYLLSIMGVLNTLITAPLVGLGIVHRLIQNRRLSFVLVYILIVCFVAFISFQSRHRIMFMIFHPYFAYYGLEYIKTKLNSLLLIYSTTLLFLLILNL